MTDSGVPGGLQHLEVSTRALADSNEACDGGRQRKGAKKKEEEEKEEEEDDDDDDEDDSTHTHTHAQQQEPFNECTHARDSKQLFDEWQKKNAFHIVIIRQQSPPCTLNPPTARGKSPPIAPRAPPRHLCGDGSRRSAEHPRRPQLDEARQLLRHR